MLSQITQTSWLSEVFSGTPGLVILGVLGLLSLAALALVVEQLLSLRRGSLLPEGLASQIAKRLEAGDLTAAAVACDRQPSYLASIVRSGLLEAETGDWAAVEKAMEDTAEEGAARLLRRIDYLSVIGNLAPMLGLLGTVVGMIFAFREVAATEGAATATELASGIYQALVTTVGGLLVAIPSLAAYAVLRNRVDTLAAEAATQAEQATRPLKRALTGNRKAGQTTLISRGV
jgi:biopolymer transport protein ExbB